MICIQWDFEEKYMIKKSVSTRPRQEVPENVGHILYGLSGAHRYFTIRYRYFSNPCFRIPVLVLLAWDEYPSASTECALPAFSCFQPEHTGTLDLTQLDGHNNGSTSVGSDLTEAEVAAAGAFWRNFSCENLRHWDAEYRAIDLLLLPYHH